MRETASSIQPDRVTQEVRDGARAGQIPIFVVSLARATSRRAKISAALEALGLDFEFVDAVDAVSGVPAELEGEIDRTVNPQLSEPEYGCALSHALLYRRIVEEGIEHSLVMEDDAIPSQALKRFVDEGCYRLFPLIQLFHGAAYIRRGGKKPMFEGWEAFPLAVSCSFTVSYSISLEAAQALQAVTTPVKDRADWPMELRDLNAAVARPILVGHPEDRSDSTIAADRSRVKRSKNRYLDPEYRKRKWRRFLAKRVRSAQ
ncbi:MAG: glycosyltransferase family 25 protein [Planctomycetota bacterium]|nr:glycosyltransferase family 25 protein [Planctomycetota bacterium]